ncbi:hypothetical protein ZOSMA_563G00010 [Zostera marina]|uniref:Uncharacterized protein n=1 Tax=Zostera marina TaxID=29655 RepID=A0A0K9NVY8_ZOSMR|nr:hypothetical protein ZOSMA_563G00010 [Zostera marina]
MLILFLPFFLLKVQRDGLFSYASLERKAVFYEKPVIGDLPDEEDKEYCVDFFHKPISHDSSKSPERKNP